MHYTEQIAQWVRLSGSPDELAAFRWVEQELRTLGLETALLFHDAYISLPGRAELSVTGLGPLAAITHAMAAAGAGTGTVVYGDDVDATGHILLADGLATPRQVLAAEARGAQALIMINGEHHHEMIVSPVWGSPTAANVGELPRIPVLSIRHADGERLKQLLRQGPVEATYKTEVDTGWRQTPILVADVPGPTPEYVMFSGHLDSWHHGAMDNGSANAVMMEVGRLVAGARHQLRRGLKLIFWSGHSHGRYSGSAWYADNHWHDLYENCIAHINIDSPGGKGATVLTQGAVHAELQRLAAAVIAEYTGVQYTGQRVNRSSDQSFVGIGIPSLWGDFSEQPPPETPEPHTQLFGPDSGGLGWWWHTVHDTIDKIDPDLLVRDCTCFVAATARLLFAERLPLDPAAAAASFQRELHEYAVRAGDRFDLSPALTRAARLVALAQALNSTDVPADAFNRAVRQLSRRLIPLQYTEAGPFGHDPALPVPPIPSLRWLDELLATEPGSDAEKFVRPLVTRGLNAVCHGLQQAIELLQHVSPLA